jgi:tetratricopeptide (TPR) repeat protein
MSPRFSKLFAIGVLLLEVTTVHAADPALAETLWNGPMNDAMAVLLSRNDPESLHLLSRAYYSIEDWDNAIQAGERALSMRPGTAGYHLWMGREYGEKAANSNPLKAAALAHKTKVEFENSVKLDPENVQARADLAEYYVEAPAIMGGGLDKAREQAAQVQKYDAAMSHWILSRVARKEKRFPDEERELRAGLKVAKNPAEYQLHLASYYRSQDRPGEMETLVMEAVKQPNRPAHTYYDAATVLYEGGRDFPLAAEYLKKYIASGDMVEDAPAFRAHYRLGQVYEGMGDRSAAASEYRQSLSLASGFAPARAALGRLQ